MNDIQTVRTQETENERLTMKEMPPQERPYEKCLALGCEHLTDTELLAVILRTGSQGETALRLASRILHDSFSQDGLLGLHHSSIEELMQIRGVGKVKAVQLKCIAELSRRLSMTRFSEGINFRSPEEVAAYFMESLRHEEQEVLVLVLLNNQGKLIKHSIISKGTVRASIISPREIFIEATRNRAVGIILLHNHPGGDPRPSQEDIHLTLRVREAGTMLGIELLDHIIIGDRQAVSLREHECWQAEEI